MGSRSGARSCSCSKTESRLWCAVYLKIVAADDVSKDGDGGGAEVEGGEGGGGVVGGVLGG